MNVGFYSARTGLIATQQGLDVISNNIANVETIGFKALRPSFSDLLYTSQQAQHPEAQTGHGTKLEKTDLMFSQGQLMMTKRSLDFAIPNDGLFAVQDAGGQVKYTRDGTFFIKQNGTQWNLVNSQGMNVLDYNKQPIAITYGADGEIDYNAVHDAVGVFKFDNPYGLSPVGSNLFSQTAESGEAIADRKQDKLSGALEMSSVEVGEQMIKVIELQRAFQLNSKMVQTADEIETIVNNLR